jgi:biotin synthase
MVYTLVINISRRVINMEAINMNVQSIKQKVLQGDKISREEADFLVTAPLEDVKTAANEIREHFCQNKFDLCTIVSAKAGRCPENCKFCAQSAFYNTGANEYPLMSNDEIFNAAKYNADKGVPYFSIVTSGKRLTDDEIDSVCEVIRKIKAETKLSVCTSMGLISKENFRKLKESGVTRIHNNLETSRDFFKNICTTHTFDDKVNTIKTAKEVGLDICSGGIIGLGESFKDRLDLAFALADLGIKSVPINILSPIKGTPFENNAKLEKGDVERTFAIFRFILPTAYIRLAGGRANLDDSGVTCMQSGANASITGDLLTTSGTTIDKDLRILDELNYVLNEE